MEANQTIIWLILLPLVGSPLVYLTGRIGLRLFKVNIARWVSLLVLLAAGYPLYFAGQNYLAGNAVQYQLNSIPLRIDGISLIMSLVVLVLGALSTLFSFTYMKSEEGEEKFYALLTAMIGTIIGLSCAVDLFNLWVWFEAMAITSYMLVSFYREQKASLEAGVKYLVQSATGSVLVILGVSLVFATTGTLNLTEISAKVITLTGGSSYILLAAGALFLIGFGVKSALVPMHTWLPDAHSQAPSGISAMLSGIVIEAGLIALLRSIGSLSASSSTWGNLLIGFGVVNCLIGNLMALRQTQIKRLLAYSSVAHMGYMVIGLGIAITYNLQNAAAGSFFHLITHALMKGLAFLAAGSLLYALYIANGHHGPLTKDDLAGAATRYPLAAFAFSVAVLSLGGLPPLAGFMSKWQIIVAAFQTQSTGMYVLAIFIALNSVLSLGYYAPLVNRIYRHSPSPIVQEGKPLSIAIGIPMVLLSLAIIVLGFYPALVNWITGPAASSLLAAFGM
jgi:proton-translocating NADH-quinone oxidoreductase chain N